MNFDLTEEQQQLRALVREFADREVAPGAGRGISTRPSRSRS